MTHFYLNRARLAITRESAGEPDMHAPFYNLDGFKEACVLANSYNSDWERQEFLRLTWEENKPANHQDAAKSVLVPFGNVSIKLAHEIAEWQREDRAESSCVRLFADRRMNNDLAIRNAQNELARRTATTREHLFAIIDRKAAILRDWCMVEA